MGVFVVGLGVAVGLIGAVVTGGLVHRWGLRSGFVDRPDDYLKTHTGTPVPLGGFSLMVGVHGGMAMAGFFDIGLFFATAIVFAIGLLDDWKEIPPFVRLAGAATAGIVLVLLSNDVTGGIAGLAVVLLVVLTVNAINLLDGLDSLAAGVSAVAFVGLAVYAGVQGVSGVAALLIAPAGLLGFLYWNLPPARLYLGDNGAYVIGVLLVSAVLSAGADLPTSLFAVALIGVPFLDLAATVVRRVIARKPLFVGDRDHSYDRLHMLGVSPAKIGVKFAVAQGLWAAVLIIISLVLGPWLSVFFALVVGVIVIVVFSAALAAASA